MSVLSLKFISRVGPSWGPRHCIIPSHFGVLQSWDRSVVLEYYVRVMSHFNHHQTSITGLSSRVTYARVEPLRPSFT
ncbi:hypothetical protein OROGR_031005 [Orobanche gracilis]